VDGEHGDTRYLSDKRCFVNTCYCSGVELPAVDPRVKRTRAALREALTTLLRDRSFDDITLAEVAESAGLNRATIYKHHADKFALLDAWIADDLRARLYTATMGCERTGVAKLAAVVGATCECLRWVGALGRPDDRLLRPIAEARITTLLVQTIEFAIAEKIVRAVTRPPELAANMAASAICAAARVWAAGEARALDAHVAKTTAAIAPLLVGNPQMPAKMTNVLAFT
jgi:AcrR family transcriptional regulator